MPTYSRTFRTNGLASAVARSVSFTLHAKIVGLSERRKKVEEMAFSSFVKSTVRAGFPASSQVSILTSTASSAMAILSPRLASRATRSRFFLTVSRSASISSVLMTSMSRTGSMDPAT